MTRRCRLQCAGAFAALALLCTHPAAGLEPELVRPVRPTAVPAPPPPQLASLRIPPAVAGPFAPTSVPSLDGSPVDYLVLTSEALAPAFERLAAWKTARGVPAVVRTLTQVEAAGIHGSDRAETLRLYIRNAYLYWGVRFVLLGGDTEIIPPRYAGTEFLGLKNPITDLYYSCLDGDWNADGDGQFGEAYESPQDPGDAADLIAEVFVGRAPVSTLGEANLFVDKTLAYERPAITDFQSKVLLLAEVLFPTSWIPGMPVSIDGAEFTENLRLNVFPPELQVTRLYENYTAPANLGSTPLTVASATTRIDSGYCTVVHVGHGYRYSLSVGDGSLDVGDAGSFGNGARAGLVYMLNCTSAAYDFESFAEAMLLDPNGGATLVVGAAREAFPLAASDYQYAFFRHLYTLGQHRVGEVLARSREEFLESAQFNTVDRWTQLTYTLLGDPEIPLWTAAPRALLVEGAPATLAVGGTALDLTVRDASGAVRGARVCAAKAGEDYRVVFSDSAGHARLQVEARSAGEATFTVTASDHLPLQWTIPAVVPQRALALAGDGLVDDGAGSGSGNADGRLDAGETASLALGLRNLGTLPVTGLQATLDTDDPDLQVLQSASSYPDLDPATEAAASTPFVVQVRPSTPDGRVATLVLHLEHDATTETRTVTLLVHAARPRLVGVRLDDSRVGDGDGLQDADEEIDLYYTVENGGTGTLQSGQLALTSLDPEFEVLAGTAGFAAIAPAARAECASPLTVRENDLAARHRGRLVLRHLQDAVGQSRRIDLRPPAAPSAPSFLTVDQVDAVHIEWTAPADDDLLGYHVFRAPAAGGSFTRVDLDPVRPTYFRDTGLEGSTRYDYRIAALDSSLFLGELGAAGSVSTNPPQIGGWPLAVSDRSSSSPGVADVDGDGGLDLVAGSRQIYAWHGNGIELLDADQNALTWGLFYGSTETFGSITLADLDREPGKEIVAATWDPLLRFVVVMRGDGTPLPGWPRPLLPTSDAFRGALVAPVVANLDGAGAPEILLAARDGRLYGWHADGSEIADGDADPATPGVLLDTASPFLRSAPGVADLDPARPGFEIALGGANGQLYVLDAHGAPLPGWPRASWGSGTPFEGVFSSGISIADLDGDSKLEMLFVDGTSRLHAMRLDGSELAGFPVEGIRAVSQSVTPSPAVGDLVGDARLEVVIASSDGKLHVLDAAGHQLLPGGWIDVGGNTESSPILGDVDGDAGIEIVLGNEQGILNAWNLDGTPVVGFPISLRAEVRGTPTLADLNGDGNADLTAVTWDGLVHVWDLGVPWRPERAPWPTYRGNVHRTGEFGYAVPTPVALQDLAAETTAAGAVRLHWRGVMAPRDAAVTWRIHRAGPFAACPLGGAADSAYALPPIGERRGSGDLDFVDVAVEPGGWYAYVIGIVEPRAGGEPEVSFSAPVAVQATARPLVLRILANVPNPFNPATLVRFEVPSRDGPSPVDVELSLFDVQGRWVRTLFRGRLGSGAQVVRWDGRDAHGREAASGVYVARLVAGGRAVTHKLTLLR